MLFDNSLNEKRFRIDIRTEKGYEEGCKRGAKMKEPVYKRALLSGDDMPFWVYILQSDTSGRYYTGHTDNLERRLGEHNDPGYLGSKTTKRFKGPWKVIWTQQVASRSEAMFLEKQIKNRGAFRYVHELSGRVPPRRD